MTYFNNTENSSYHFCCCWSEACAANCHHKQGALEMETAGRK